MRFSVKTGCSAARLLSYSAIVCWLVGLAALPASGQTRHEIIRGRVTTDSGRPVLGATVRAQRAPDRAQAFSPTRRLGGALGV